MRTDRNIQEMLWREKVANTPKHWVRAVTACNSKCLFCLDSDTPRNVYLREEDVKAEIDRGIDELGAERIIISGGEASLHPLFAEFVRYAKERGYDRVQTVTNGYRFSDKKFFDASLDAGLGEITFSLHGHTPELHDRLTGTPGAFKKLLKGLVRALRDGRPIVNVDVVINKQNVAVIDKIVELCIRLGVTEFDLLHVIPQAAAFDNRDELFYDVQEHLPVLHEVFRLNRHPQFVVWTNRFPVSYLEGLEDLIQDPHKMLDEVNGRRFQVRRYLDTGKPLDCRDPERCPHCFIEPFCTTMDRVVEAQHSGEWRVWWTNEEGYSGEPLPFGCDTVGVVAQDFAELQSVQLPEGVGVFAVVRSAEPMPNDFGRPLTLVARRAEQLDAWLTHMTEGVEVDVHLNRDTGPWLLANRALLAGLLDRVRIHQPSHEHLLGASDNDVRNPRELFLQLDLPIRVSGLPACLAPGARWTPARAVLDADLFDAGRLAIRPLARYHVMMHYQAKSVRCDECAVSSRCEGAHINMVRDQGLKLLHPLSGDEAEAVSARLDDVYPEVRGRLSTGMASQSASPSLPGFPMPDGAPPDPLAVIARERMFRRGKRMLPLLGEEG